MPPSATTVAAPAPGPVRLHAAGSLEPALTEIAAVYREAAGVELGLVFGPSGLLRERIAGGERVEIFASANMAHPQALAAAGRGGPVVLFARNRLCALVRPNLGVSGATLLDRMLDPGLRLATSTPRADPAGDYAWALFAKAEMARPGSRAALEAKALMLVGGPNSPQPPPGRTAYGHLMERGEADIFLTYRTNAVRAAREVPGLEIVTVPEALAVGADYGLILLTERPAAASFALFILSPAGQTILARHGFVAPTLPAAD